MPSGARYWTVVDDELRPVPVADAFLRHVRFGRDDAESTTKTYAGAVALYLIWCGLTGLDWRTAADRLGSFVLWLRHTPVPGRGRDGGVVVAGPGPGRFGDRGGSTPCWRRSAGFWRSRWARARRQRSCCVAV